MKSLIFCFLTFSALYFCCVSSENSTSVLCIKSERDALLQFKADLTDGANRLFSWSGYNKDCCKWAGVVCNNITGHVQELHLGGPNDGPYDTDAESEEASKQMLGGDLNPSLMSLKQLNYLDLSFNDFGGIPIPSFLASIQSLRYLNLSTSQFDGQIPHQLGNLTMLRVLDLRYGVWQSVFPVKNLRWLSSLNMLQHLDLSGYDLSSERDWLQVMNRFPSLLELRLSSCSLSQLPRHLNTINLTSLSVLDLSFNSFDTSFMPGWIFNLTSLVSLDLTNCLLHNLFPGVVADFQKLTSLRVLHVSGNDVMNHSSVLEGIPSLINLVSLDLSTCYLTKPILNDLRNMSSLVSLDLSNNKINETLPTSLVNLCNLRYVELQSNHLSGSISELLENLCECKTSKLESIGFWGNYLVGYLPENLGRLQNLITFDLGFNFLTGEIPESIGTLPNLETLVLNENLISGAIPDSIGQLSALKRFDLSHNQLTGSLPNSFGNLSKLTVLYVYNNMLNGSVTIHHFANLTSLGELKAENNKLTLYAGVESWVPPFQLTVLRIGSWDLGPNFPSWLKSQGNLTQLDISNANISDAMPEWFWTTFSGIEFLNISHNRIQGKLTRDLDCWVNWGSLAVLSVENNRLSGGIPESMGEISSLKSLNMRRNNLAGKLPLSVMSSKSLLIVDLADNKLTGVTGTRNWRRPTSLRLLSLRSNKLEGEFPNELCRLTSIQILDLASNNISGNIPKCFHNFSIMSGKQSSSPIILYDEFVQTQVLGSVESWVPPFQLTVLRIGSWDLGPNFPSWLKSQGNLTQLDISNANISDAMPEWFWTTFSGIEFLNISHNRIQGKLTRDLGFLATNAVLDLHDNYFEGPLPASFNRPDIDFVDLSTNRLSGYLNRFLCTKVHEPSQLKVLNLANNNLSGVVPDCWVNWGSLAVLSVENNRLSGGIPESMGEISSLKSLNMRRNNLAGKLPLSVMSSKSLLIVDLADNKLTGVTGTRNWRRPTSLRLLSLRSNKLEGEFPNELCRLTSIQILDLASNNISGNIPKCFHNFSIMEESSYSSILYLVTTLDLSDNCFSGNIPNELMDLEGLRYLNLSRNQLTGRIPESIGDMRLLESLDLSSNMLQGGIPSSISNLTFLNWLNVSYNSLTGRIPTSTQMQSFSASSFVGNKLCGAPLNGVCGKDTHVDKRKGEVNSDDENEVDWVLIISLVVGFFVGFWVVVGPLAVNKAWRITYFGILDKVSETFHAKCQ
nr:leucine-rich repeat-containing protein [Tanacetum cinerariifolium]